MQELTDTELLRQYAEHSSEEAFETIVTRHVNLVYSAAYRKTGNFHAAEEIAQAVFIILAKKAGSLRRETVLPGWLYQAARLTAANFLRNEIRRARREQEASMQPISREPEPDAWPQIVPLLEDAMGRLNEKERNAIILRFFEGKSFQEVGAALGSTENAAKKRVAYSLEKMRVFFAKNGVQSTTANIAGAISSNSIQTAPAGLAKTISATALAKGFTASASTLTLAKGALKIMAWTKVKTAIVVGAAVAAGAGSFLVYHLVTARASASHLPFLDSVPVQFDNSVFRPDGDQNGTFVVEVDPNTRRTTNSSPAIHIGGPLGPDGSSIVPTPANANGSYPYTDNSSSTTYYVTDRSVLYGQHIRVTGWLKTRNARGWGSAFVIIMGLDGRKFQYDDMSDRPISGTTDWQPIEIVTDLPDEPCLIYFGPDLYGPGELWGDDFQITLAPPGTPSTDVRNWRLSGESNPNVYSEETDFNATHNGHPAVCLAYTPNGRAPRGAHTRFGRNFYGSDSDKYCGHTVRMSGWLKTENVSGHVAPVILPYVAEIGGGNKLLANHSNYSLKGTHDWSEFSITCVIPNETEYIHTGFDFYGGGKVWIDLDSVKFEIIK